MSKNDSYLDVCASNDDLVLTANERLLIENFRDMEKIYQITMWELIEDLALQSVYEAARAELPPIAGRQK